MIYLGEGDLQVFPGGCHDQFPVLHALGADKIIRQVLDVLRRAFDGQYLQTVIMIQVHVHRGDHRIVMLVLLMGQSLLELPLVVVVNDGNGAHRLRGFVSPLFLNQAVANQVAEGFRAIRIPVFGYVFVKPFQ